MLCDEVLHADCLSRARAFDRRENQCAGLHVPVDDRLHLGATVEPVAEFLNQPRVDPLGLLEKLNFLSLSLAVTLPLERLAREHLDLPVVQDRGAILALHPHVFLGPVVEASR